MSDSEESVPGLSKKTFKKVIIKKETMQETTTETISVKPKVSEMVDSALKNLHNRKGISLVAIKKHISGSYIYNEVQMKRIASKIRQHIVDGLENQTLTQIKGKGASGTFKLTEKPTVTKKKAKIDKKKSDDVEIKAKAPKKKAQTKNEESKSEENTVEKTKKGNKSVAVIAKRNSIHVPKIKIKTVKSKEKKAPNNNKDKVKKTVKNTVEKPEKKNDEKPTSKPVPRGRKK